ncbi:ABC transporter permease [Chloroflexota bacterium]
MMSENTPYQEKERWTKRIEWLRKWPVIPLVIIALLIIVGVFAPLIAPYSPTAGELSSILAPPSAKYVLGADSLGRDTMSRLVYGARVSLVVSMLAIFIGGGIGVTLGIVAGYFGGWPDIIVMRMVDITLSIPLLLMAVLLAAVAGPSFQNVILIVSLLIWPRYARQVRGETLSIKTQDYVDLARASGCSDVRIMWRHIFPNLIPTILVLVTLQIGWVIILESSLSFLGVGIPPPQPSWGSMVASGRDYITSAPWLCIYPGFAILFTVLAFNSFGDWLRDRLDPKLREL